MPEFDTPAHSLALTKVRPDLIYEETLAGVDHLNLHTKYDETISFVQSIFNEYMTGENPVFDQDTIIHVGTDEYDEKYKEDFRKYTDDTMLYIVPGVTRPGLVGPYYHDYLDTQWLYNNWDPTKFGSNVTVSADSQQLLGATFAVWNDKSGVHSNGITEQDIYDRFADALPALASKMWGKGMDLSGYTAESVATFRVALANAQAVMADNSLTEDDQTKVNDAVAALTAAMDGLTAGGAPETSDKPETSQKPESTDKPQTTEKPENVPQTGDSAPLTLSTLMLVGSALCVLALVVSAKRRRS